MTRPFLLFALTSLLFSVPAGCSRSTEDSEQDAQGALPSAATSSPPGRVRLDTTAQQRIGLAIRRLTPEAIRPELKAYGRLQEDPDQSFSVRAPAAGVLYAPVAGAWPSLGQQLEAAQIVGRIEPRYPPTDRINLTDRLLTARADERSAAAAVEAAKAAYERARILNADDKNVSDRALQEAKARLEAEEAKLEAAKQVLSLVESSIGSGDPARFVPLTVERRGEVIEALTQPGEDVAVGTPLLRVVSFDRVLANIALPVGHEVPHGVQSARIVPVGSDGKSLSATLLAVSPSVDPAVQSQSLLFRLSTNGERLRPGQAVTAYLPLPGQRSRSIVLPSSAVVRQAGESYAYVQESDDAFSRRRLGGLRPTADGYIVQDGLSEGENVVITGAQLLLSEEMKSEIAAGDDE